ncbi:AraC family transcriptional regulator [Streptomyces sp. NPDC050504]|uniref:AraC family transcriptional regulator n=1 Tax=Streptomyces sp. NPDC050504 TaxID=3365618 RepID=UPI0037A8D5B3
MSGATVLTDGDIEDEPAGVFPMHRLDVPMPNSLPFAIGTFDSIGPMSRADFPHRHTFYEIVYVTGGTGTHVRDLHRAELRPPHLEFILPGQLHHWEDCRGVEGYVVLFTEDFLLDHPGDREILRRLGAAPWRRLDERANGWAGPLVADLDREYRMGAGGFDSVLRALLHILIVRAGRRLAEGPAVPERAPSVVEEFVGLVAGSDPAGLSVRACAERIGVSVGHLSEIVKEATGRTPGELVRQARTHEAKRLLARTELTVRQVALRVGFDDPAYFCRFFRRETGTSPGAFRKGGGDFHHDHRIPSIAGSGAGSIGS